MYNMYILEKLPYMVSPIMKQTSPSNSYPKIGPESI